MPASPKEIRKARSFLYARGLPVQTISPRRFASAAKELGIGFRELLAFIARLYGAGQNQSQFRLEAIRKIAERGE